MFPPPEWKKKLGVVHNQNNDLGRVIMPNNLLKVIWEIYQVQIFKEILCSNITFF